MPIITNFGDVVTVGNAAVNGTGTSSFAGPVTFAQGVSVTGAVSALSAFYGVLAGNNTAALSTLTASVNVYAPIITTPVSNAATAIATTGFYGKIVGDNTAAVSVLTATGNVNAPTVNVASLNVSTQANVTFLNVSGFTTLFQANVLTANISSSNVLTENVATLNVSGFATLFRANVLTANITSSNILTGNVATLNVSGFTTLFQANVLTANISSSNVLTENVATLNVSGFATIFRANVLTANITSSNVLTENVATLNVSGFATIFRANVLTANITSSNVLTENVATLNVSGFATIFQANVLTANVTSLNVSTQANLTFLNVSSSAFLANANVLTANILTANISSLNVTGDANIANLTVRSNLYASNIIMSSNLSTNTGFGNVYLTGNLVVQGNIFSIGGSVGSGSGTSQGVLYSLPGTYSLGSAFSTGTAGPAIAGYHINMASFSAEAVASVSAFSAGSGMLKFATGGLYQVTCVIVGDQPVVKLAFGKTSSSSFPPVVTATAGYDYVYNFPVGSSPSTVITIPLTVLDTSQYYYLDVFFSTAAGTPSILYPTRSTTAVGSAYGTYVQVGPFGNYLTSATGVASGLLMNAYGTTTLSSPVTSNTFRLAMTSSNGWTVSGVSTALTVTSGGNFQVNQVGIYEVSMCLNAVGATPLLFGVGSLAADTAPSVQGPYLYQYAPMYTQDPTTIVTMPLNITDTSKYYYVDVIFPGSQATVGLSNVSTFVSLKPVGSYVSPSTSPWAQQGSSVTYSGGAVGIGGVNPSALTETFTVNGTTAFVGNVTVTSDASGSTYVLGKRVPAGSLDVSQYVTGSVPLTTTTSLINNYLSNAAQITANTSTGTITQALYVPATTGSFVNLGTNHSVNYSNLALSNLFVEAWVNISTTGVTRILAARTNGTTYDFTLQITSGNIVTFDVYNTAGSLFRASNATTLSAGTWYHVSGSYNRTGLTAGTVLCFVNGGVGGTTGTVSVAGPRVTPTANIYIAGDNNASVQSLAGNVADVRVMTKCIVPITTFSPQSAPFTTAPTYRTGMDTGYTSNLTLTLQTSYFPGASTSPYGPCLTLPGTVGSFYSQLPFAAHSDWKTTGFTLEAWVNYASFANSNVFNTGASYPFMITTTTPPPGLGSAMYGFGPTTTGQIAFVWWASGGTNNAFVTSNTITTGTWNHLMVQGNGSNVYMAINGNFTTLTAQGFIPTSGSGTVAPTLAPSTTTGTPTGSAMTVGQYYTYQGPNFAIAKARLIYGANVYSSGSFTPNPNFATSATAPFWSLDTQYPLPTYPSIQDVTPLALQSGSFGAVPTPIGGVTSNVLSPYPTTYPQLDSIRFDGTGYIDYGNAASSVLTSNIWASPWTIEGWVYPTAFPGGANFILGRGNDFMLYITTAHIGFASNIGSATNYNAGAAGFAAGSWYHMAVTFDGTRSNVYVGGALSNTIPVSAISTPYTPTSSFQVGIAYNTQYQGNLADVRVSNVARYTGSSYTVPTEPFTTDSSTLLLLKSLGGQVGTTLEVQGRGLNAVSLGATQTVRAYPPAPMRSYLLDTTSNALVTYGQGKYVASASSEFGVGTQAWLLFNKASSNYWQAFNGYSTTNPYPFTGSITTVDTVGNSYSGEWVQLQMPVSIILSSYVFQPYGGGFSFTVWAILGSRDGTNWTLVDRRSGITWVGIAPATAQTFTASATQSYNYYRLVGLNGSGTTVPAAYAWVLNGIQESLCITSDAKVGVGIANPQRALEVAGDLIVGGTISGGAGMGGFRNRIINGDMRIAQRGVGPSTVSGSDTVWDVDRWKTIFITSGTFTTGQSAVVPLGQGFSNSFVQTMTVATIANDYAATRQQIEGYNMYDLSWGTSYGQPVTLSFWTMITNVPAGSILPVAVIYSGSSSSYYYLSSYTVSAPSAWQYVTLTVPPPPSAAGPFTAALNTLHTGVSFPLTSSGASSPAQPNTWVSSISINKFRVWGTYDLASTVGWSRYITGVQIERGTVATPFEFRPYAQELALCQRYFYQIMSPTVAVSGAATQFSIFGVGLNYTTTSGDIVIFYPVAMRTAIPTFSSSAANTFQVVVPSGSVVLTAISGGATDSNTPQTARVSFTVASGLLAGNAVWIRSNSLSGSSVAYIAFSCEL